MSTNGNRYAFRGRSVNSSGAINVTEIVTRDGNWYFEDMCAAVRPVIVLKSDVTIDNGTGTKLDPYSFN